jgi:hypothetical protein
MDATKWMLGLAGLMGLCGVGHALHRAGGNPFEGATSYLGEESHSPVRILRSDDELQEALQRALRFDQDAEDVLQRRIDRYSASGREHTAPVIDLAFHKSDATVMPRQGTKTA